MKIPGIVRQLELKGTQDYTYSSKAHLSALKIENTKACPFRIEFNRMDVGPKKYNIEIRSTRFWQQPHFQTWLVFKIVMQYCAEISGSD